MSSRGVALLATWMIPLACATRHQGIQKKCMITAQLFLEQLGWVQLTGGSLCLQFLPGLQRIQ